MEYPQWIPKGFEFIAVRDTVYIPLIWQLLLLELAIDGLKLAAVNTPNMLSTPLSVMAALVLGEFSVKSGWFNSEVMLYMAFVAVANYTQNSLELGLCAEIYADYQFGADGNFWRLGICWRNRDSGGFSVV